MSFGFMSVVNRYENRKIGGKRRTSFYFAMYINKPKRTRPLRVYV
jgi:hypothetical protein